MILLLCLAFCGIMVCSIYPKTRHPIRSALFTTCSGTAGLLAVNLTSALTGVTLAFNGFTGAVAVILGLPGVVFLLLLRLLAG